MSPRKANELQLEIFRRMTLAERAECCFRWTKLTCEFARAGIRSMHPDWTPEQVERELGRRITGIDVTKLPWEKVLRQQEEWWKRLAAQAGQKALEATQGE